MTDETPDYTTMSGAEFRRAVGTDPEKWAEAFMQRHLRTAAVLGFGNEELARWFADAMDAARRDRAGDEAVWRQE